MFGSCSKLCCLRGSCLAHWRCIGKSCGVQSCWSRCLPWHMAPRFRDFLRKQQANKESGPCLYSTLFPLKWFCMVLLACGPAIVANCIKFRYPYIYIQYLCNITYLYVFIYVEITNVDSWWFAFRCKEAFVRSCFCWPFSAQEPAWQPSSRTCIEVTIDFDPLHLRLILESWKLEFCRNVYTC